MLVPPASCYRLRKVPQSSLCVQAYRQTFMRDLHQQTPREKHPTLVRPARNPSQNGESYVLGCGGPSRASGRDPPKSTFLGDFGPCSRLPHVVTGRAKCCRVGYASKHKFTGKRFCATCINKVREKSIPLSPDLPETRLRMVNPIHLCVGGPNRASGRDPPKPTSE